MPSLERTHDGGASRAAARHAPRPRRRASRRAHGTQRGSSSSPACRGRERPTRFARSRTSGTSASTTCPVSSFRRWRSWRRATMPVSRRSRSSSTCAKADSSSEFPKVYRKLQAMPGVEPTLIFLEASRSTLVRRFSETRRPHPLAPDRSVGRRDRRGARQAEPDPVAGGSDHRHLESDRARTARRLHAHVAATIVRAAEMVVNLVSFGYQAWCAGGRRSGVRRALPAEPALRRSTARR